MTWGQINKIINEAMASNMLFRDMAEEIEEKTPEYVDRIAVLINLLKRIDDR